jgi:high-affinity iron transporter
MGSFVITLREGFEAALIVCLILAYLAKTGQLRAHGRAVWLGVAAAIGVSILIGGILFASVGELEGTAEAVFEGTAMVLAACVLTWMVFWMRRQAATIGAHLRSQVAEAVSVGGGFALATVAFIGVAREGIETALFMFAATDQTNALVQVTGGALGLVAAIGLGVLFYRGALRLDLRKFFTVTSVLVIALAAYLIYGASHELGEAAGNEALEESGPILALLYGAGFALLYLRDSRRPASEGEPAAAKQAS